MLGCSSSPENLSVARSGERGQVFDVCWLTDWSRGQNIANKGNPRGLCATVSDTTNSGPYSNSFRRCSDGACAKVSGTHGWPVEGPFTVAQVVWVELGLGLFLL